VYVSVTRDSLESTRTRKDFNTSAYYTPKVYASNIVNNKPGMNDTFTVTGTEAGNVINVYKEEFSTTLLGSFTVPAGQTSINISIPEIGPGAGWLFITQQEPGKEESYRKTADLFGEPDFVSDQTPFIVTYEDVYTANNDGAETDYLGIKDAPIGYVIKVYKTETGNDLLDTFTVTAVNQFGYQVFALSEDLGNWPGDIYLTQTAPNLTESVRKYIAYSQEVSYEMIRQSIVGVTKPVTGATPVATIAATSQYTATISWSPADAAFAPSTVYTATITITPKAGQTLTDILADHFTVAGATATNEAGSGVVTAVFPATGP
jgi:hypothetical protein